MREIFYFRFFNENNLKIFRIIRVVFLISNATNENIKIVKLFLQNLKVFM